MSTLRARRWLVTLEDLEAIYRLHGAAFERVAIAIVGDEQLGCDTVHDAFVLAVRNRGRYRGEAPLEAWLWRILINEARRRRSREGGIVVADPSEIDRGAVSLNGAGDRSRVRSLLAALPDRQRHALFLRHYADLDYATIAHVLEVRPGTVAATLNAGHKRLRAQLEEVHEWEL